MKLKLEEEMGVDLMAQHALLRKNLHILQKDVDTQKDEIRKLRDKEIRLTDTIKSLEKDIHGHKKEIREREETISDKEKRIFDLKKKNQELEKFRFVLDYKIKELKLQIAPRETEIATMKKQGEEMNLELEQYNRSNLALNLMIEELKLKLDGLRRELLSQKDVFDMNNKLEEKFKRNLSEMWNEIDRPMQLKEGFLKLYREYVQEGYGSNSGINGSNNSNNENENDKNNKNTNGNGIRKRPNNNNEDPQVAYNRDREMLERSLNGLKKALKAEVLSNKREVAKMMRERSQLTKELNLLRRDAGDLRLKYKAIEQAGLIGPKMDVVKLKDTLNLLGINMIKRNHTSVINSTGMMNGTGIINGTEIGTGTGTGTGVPTGTTNLYNGFNDRDQTKKYGGTGTGTGIGIGLGSDINGGIKKGFGGGVGKIKGSMQRDIWGSKSAGSLRHSISAVRSASTSDTIGDGISHTNYTDSHDTADEYRNDITSPVRHRDEAADGVIEKEFGNTGMKGGAGIRAQKEKKSPGKSARSVHRTIALRTTSASGRVESTFTVGEGTGTLGILRQKKLKNDQYEAMREIQMQNRQMQQAEEQLRILCDTLSINADDLVEGINANLSYP